MRLDRLGLRARVTVAMVTFVAVLVSVQGVLAYLSLSEQEDDLADEWVTAEAARLAEHAARGDLEGDGVAALLAPSPHLRAWWVDAQGTERPEALPDHLRGLAPGIHWMRRDGGELHVVVRPLPQGALYVQYDAVRNEDRVRQFGIYLLLLGLVCAVLAALASWRIAALIAGPIERLTQQLNNWAPDAGTPGGASTDEERQLQQAFGRVQQRFEAVLAAQREFVENVRHEVRTPLTALRTDLEMLAFGAGGDPAADARIRRAVSLVDAVGAALESARAISGGAAHPVQVDLAECVDDAWASLGGEAEMAPLVFANEVARGTIVSADRHALLTILRNLVRNAAEHASPGRCIVRYGDDRIEVIDDGPGIAESDLESIFDRYYRGRLNDAPGTPRGDRGLGLAIARQAAEANGWSLTAAAQSGRGARFVLRLT